VGLDFLQETIEIVPAALDIGDQPLVIDNPIAVDQAVSEVEKRFQPLFFSDFRQIVLNADGINLHANTS
jgi:hypothetical protein